MAVILEGQIRNGDCKPIEDAEVEVWYAGLNDLTGLQLKKITLYYDSRYHETNIRE